MNIDSLYRAPMTTADMATIASMPWSEFFTDPKLQTLITTGLERNTDLGIARLQVEEAQATLTNARLSYLPSLNLTPQAGISPLQWGDAENLQPRCHSRMGGGHLRKGDKRQARCGSGVRTTSCLRAGCTDTAGSDHC